MAEKEAAVISADIIGSSKMNAAVRNQLQKELDRFSLLATREWTDLSIQQYRGDSLQAVLTSNHLAALRMALLLHSSLVKEGFGIRVAIGTGKLSFKGKDIITSDGSAFQASGPYLDQIRKKGEVISVAGEKESFTGEWQIHSASLDFIIRNWTRQQAEAMYWQLQYLTQKQIAKKLKIKQPSVNQRLQGAGWSAVQKIIERFEFPGLHH